MKGKSGTSLIDLESGGTGSAVVVNDSIIMEEEEQNEFSRFGMNVSSNDTV